MAEQGLVELYEYQLINNLQEGQTDRGWGGEGDILRLYRSLGSERGVFVEAMRNVLRRDAVSEAVKIGILDVAATQNIWEIEDAVRELDVNVPTDTSEYVPGALPQSATVCLRLFINKFIKYRRASLRDRGQV